MTNIKELLKKTISQNGYWLINHEEVIEDLVKSMVDINGEDATLALLGDRTSSAYKKVRKLIDIVRRIVEETEYNENHPDDYFNAGGFFGHWEQYSQEEKLNIISKALEEI